MSEVKELLEEVKSSQYRMRKKICKRCNDINSRLKCEGKMECATMEIIDAQICRLTQAIAALEDEQKPEHKVKTYMREGVELCDFCGCHILTRAGGGHHSAECVDRRAKPEPAGELLEDCPMCEGMNIAKVPNKINGFKLIAPCPLCRAKVRITQLEKEKAEQAKEIKGLKENLIEYGRHAAGCSQEYAKKHGCRCGWWDAVEKILKCDTP